MALRLLAILTVKDRRSLLQKVKPRGGRCQDVIARGRIPITMSMITATIVSFKSGAWLEEVIADANPIADRHLAVQDPAYQVIRV